MGYGDARGDEARLGPLGAALGERRARGAWSSADNDGWDVGGGTPNEGCNAPDVGGRANGEYPVIIPTYIFQLKKHHLFPFTSFIPTHQCILSILYSRYAGTG